MKKRNVLDDEAVSPVIATILMVAITVVLAATLYMMLPKGGTGGADVSMNANISSSENGWRVQIVEGTVDLGANYDQISIYDTDTGTAVGNVTVQHAPQDEDDYGNWPADDGGNYVISFQDYGSDDELGPSDSLLIEDPGHALDGDYELRIEGVSFVGGSPTFEG